MTDMTRQNHKGNYTIRVDNCFKVPVGDCVKISRTIIFENGLRTTLELQETRGSGGAYESICLTTRAQFHAVCAARFRYFVIY